jgi:hypothetical protein
MFSWFVQSAVINWLSGMCMQYMTAFSMFFCLFVVFVNKMLFIIHYNKRPSIARVGLTTPLEFKKKAPLYADHTGLYIITKGQVHFLSFIDKTMHKSLDYVCGFSRMSQRYGLKKSAGNDLPLISRFRFTTSCSPLNPPLMIVWYTCVLSSKKQ